MDTVDKVDYNVTILLNNHIAYTGLVICLIVVIVFPEIYDVVMVKSGLNNLLNMTVVLFISILLIAYILNKDVRMGVLLSILLLTILEKHKINEINNRLVGLIVNDIKNNERITKLEEKNTK
jgi:ABC-type transport system involved in multi-copper enzyme maturation permease subunit